MIGYVVTFDDVTDLLTAQRKAAWSDVARRIAHEIKNPLTPIQLAADRLRRKYRPEDEAAGAQFSEYLSIIGRQVEDIGRMVDEFSDFARMPQPAMEELSLAELAHGQVALFEAQKVEFSTDLDKDPDGGMVMGMPACCARRSQTLSRMPSTAFTEPGWRSLKSGWRCR